MEYSTEARPMREVLSHVADEQFEVKLIADSSKRLYGTSYSVEVTKLATGELVIITGTYNRCVKHLEHLTRGMQHVQS